MADNFNNIYSANLIGLWDFLEGGETSDTGLGDGIAQDGTMVGPGTALGGWFNTYASGVRFDVDDGDDAPFDLTTGSIVTKFRPDQPYDGSQTVVSRGLADGDDASYFAVRTTEEGAVEIYHTQDGQSTQLTTDPGFFNTGDYVQVTYSWTPEGVQMLVENETQGTQATADAEVSGLSLDLTENDEQSFALAAQETTEGTFDQEFSGQIDFLAVLDDDVLTPSGGGLDGIVEGTDGDDLIDTSYTGDPEGDMVDNEDAIDPGAEPNDDVIEAYDGNDTVYAGEGDDTVDGGSGNDHLVGGCGDDEINGGTGNDSIVGDQENVLINGDFEDPGLDGPVFTFFGDLGSGWQSNSDGIETWGSSHLGVESDDGGDFIEIDRHADTVDSVYQDVHTCAGDTYELSFQATQRPGHEGQSFEVRWGGELIATITPTEAGTWETFTFEVTGSGDDRLSFTELADENNSYGPLIDNVTLTVDGNDILNGGDGDDTIVGGGGEDTITGGDGSDSVEGGEGDDVIDTSGNNPIPLPDRGFDGYSGTTPNIPAVPADADPDDDRDTVDGGAGNDMILTGDDADVITGGAGDDTIDGGIDDDIIDGGADDDEIIGGEGSDSILGGAGSDTIYGGLDESFPDALNITDDGSDGRPVDPDPTNGMDTIDGGAGNDVIFGQDDDDDLSGGTGNDMIDAGIDDDVVDGGEGDDTILGGQGDDTLTGGAGEDEIDLGEGVGEGADEAYGGINSDSFTGIGQGDVVFGGEDDDDSDVDVLDLRGVAQAQNPGGSLIVDLDDTNPENGVVTFLDADGEATGTANFYEIENIIYPCFTPGTLIATPEGERRVEELKIGDRVITRDNGIQTIRWYGRQDLDSDTLEQAAHLQPILIRQGALGNGLPERDMMVSPNHRVLVANDRTALYFEDREVLVAAKHLVGLEGIDAVETSSVTYIHFMFDQHEVVLSDGAWTESFQPGDQTLRGLDNAQRNEIYEVFPELKSQLGRTAYSAARRSLKRHEAHLLVH